MHKKIKVHPIDGGIQQPFVKPATETFIEQAPLPARVVLALTDENGTKAAPQVKAGDSVLTGQIIAEQTGKLGNPICASISGTVSIQQFLHPFFGCPVDSIVIASDGRDNAASPEKPKGDYYRYTNSELIAAVRNAAICGYRAQALHEQLTEGRRHEASVLIVDATDVEPYVCAESRLLIERAKDVTEGIRIILHILDAFKCVIAVTKETANAASTLRSVLFDEPNIFLAALPRIYPIGFPRQLARAVTGAKTMPERGGAVIITPSAAIAVNRAIKEGRPSISRAVSLGGKGISRPQILIARTGTLVSDLSGLVAQPRGDIFMPIMGGPLSGHMLQTLDVPILPGTDTITFLSKNEYSQQAPKQCLRCGACVRSCPEHLVPALLSVSSQSHDWRNFAKYRPANCAECGCCAYVCPAHRPIVQQIQEGKIAMQRAIK